MLTRLLLLSALSACTGVERVECEGDLPTEMMVWSESTTCYPFPQGDLCFRCERGMTLRSCSAAREALGWASFRVENAMDPDGIRIPLKTIVFPRHPNRIVLPGRPAKRE
jgi:hypothetical protein